MKLMIWLLPAAFLTGCVATTPAVIDPVRAPAARPIAAGVEAKPIQFRRVVIDVERGKHIGQAQGGWLCVPQGDLTWRTGRTIISDDELVKTFRDELTKANYPVVGDPNSLFDDPSEWRAEILVAGRVTALQANVCYSPTRVGDAKGEAAMTVEWQIFSRAERRVVHKTTTRGAGRLNEFTGSGVDIVFQNAFAQATRGLLGDATFHALVSRTGPAAPPPATIPAAFQLQPRSNFAGPITQRMSDVQAAVVTVVIAGGHGSGFFISNDGYALTNAHVVGNAKSVKLRLSNGREIAAEVVAVNRVRDVALLKAADANVSALPIAASELPVGSDVYAHGSPLSAAFASTVTRGIIGAYRADESLRLIQSDVTIQRGNSGGPLTDASGNVVAVAVAGLAPRGVTMGLNFFIPIDDALKGVAIERGEARASARVVRLDQPLAEALQPGRVAPPAQVASASPPPPVEPVKLDGDYQGRFTATTLQGRLTFEIYLSLVGNTIKGSGTLPTSRFGAVCRANGTVSGAGDAIVDVDCSSSNFTQSLKLKGRFAPDEGETAVVGRLVYTSNAGTTGDAIFRP